MMPDIDWPEIWRRVPLILSGLKTTLALCLVAVAITMVVALPLVLMRTSRRRALAWTANAVIALTRSVPLYIALLWLYYGVPFLLGVDVPAVTAGILVLVVQFTSFQAEAYRSGLLAVSRGQREAALAVGLTRSQTFAYVVLPQALRVAIPPTGNNFISMFKSTSIFAVIGIAEVTRLTQGAVGTTGLALEFYTALAVIYIVVVGLLSAAIAVYERRMLRS